MAPAERSRDPALSQLLVERPHRFEFFQAVRLLERLLADRAPVGGEADPERESIRFCGQVGLHFPNGAVSSIDLPTSAGDARAPARVHVSFMGLVQPNSFGSLPTPYVVLLLDELRAGRHALRDFLDLFTHRFVSLFYRAWGRSRVMLAAEQFREGYFERALYALMGLGTPHLRGRLPFDDTLLLSRAGLLLRRPAPALAIEALIQSTFDVRARIVPFQPTRAELEPGDRTRLGQANARLGHDVVVGSRVVLRDSSFRVRLGPLTREQYEAFLPHGEAYLALCRLVRLATSGELCFDVQLILRAADVPRLQLGRGEPTLPPTRLGRSTWILRARSAHDREDARLTPPPDLIPSRADPGLAA